MKKRNELFHDPNAPEAESLGHEFWEKAEVKGPQKPRSVHLKVAPDVFDFFYAESKGKGHLTQMQNVLRAYVNARRSAR
jgi:uncharacterized protein (DUF4415 family)